MVSQNGTMPNDDQCFLLNFIMGHYFGPDFNLPRPKKSALQRLEEGLPAYSYSQLAGSQMKSIELERIYYYILRKADPAVVVNLHSLRQFLQGRFHTPNQVSLSAFPQFPDLFPPNLHPHAISETQYKVIENIVFINSPNIHYIKAEDIKRFKRLTRLQSLILNSDAARLYTSAAGTLFDGDSLRLTISKEDAPPVLLDKPKKTRQRDEILDSEHLDPTSPRHKAPCTGLKYAHDAPSVTDVETCHVEGPAMVYLPSHPTIDELENIVAATRGGYALTGSAAKGQMGATIGRMDIGECDDSYIFRVSLPGVKRDEREFSCEVESDGKVLIKGVTTTGEKTVCRHSQAFQMKTQNLCPPGPFSISFQLPGPVIPENFSGKFGIDGIFEGVIKKENKVV